ncbi:IclR family transcriptional regulator [Rhodococcus ruber]|uniref:IclR family transcriptional regulator n=1 Tax=Rhodococcus ruber TaxID=1830 RepID=UPI001F2AFB16|nr:IclR family transcriptional regulator [Rhodococcus ruber]MCF8786239.1 IclR family transcriptional regulator [Rhodococcus ruber]
MASTPAASGGVQSVDRIFDLLEAMAAAEGSVGLSELADRTKLPPPTVHRLVRSLVSRGYARQLPGRGYALGPKLIPLGESATKRIGAWAGPHLSDLVASTGETANMAVLDGSMAVYVAQVPSPHAMRMFTEVGRRVHLHCTGVGKALLSQLPDDTVRQLVGRVGMLAYTPSSHTNIDALLADLAESRRRGYALDEGEQEIGVRCFSVPVPDAPTPTALSISGPAARLSIESADHNAPLLQRIAKELSAEFGKGTAG